jgi:hypothetical protein
VQVHHDEGVANRIDPESCASMLHSQPFDTLGNHPWHFGLAVCDLLRVASVIISARRPLSWLPFACELLCFGDLRRAMALSNLFLASVAARQPALLIDYTHMCAGT